MTGVIWIVQLLVYPAFASVSPDKFREFHAHHSFWITPVVAPAMIAELLCSGYLAVFPPDFVSPTLARVAFGLTLLLWASTMFIQVPLHERLGSGFDAAVHASLVNTNWIRTFLWTLRSAIVVYFVWKTIDAAGLADVR